MVAQIEKLPPGEVFMVPANGMVLANQIRDSRPAPFTGDVAVNYAMGVMRSQRVQEAVGKGVENLIKSKAATVKYNDAYKPSRPLIGPPPKAPAATPAPAAPAAPAPKP
jgi:hypothetical protein